MALPAEGDRRTRHQAGGTDFAPHLARGSISVPLEEPRDVEGLMGPRQPVPSTVPFRREVTQARGLLAKPFSRLFTHNLAQASSSASSATS